MSKFFVKMHGAGNDFLIVEPLFFGLDNKRKSFHTFSPLEEQMMSPIIKNVCARNFGVGADGLLIVSQVQNGFKMSVYNSDASFATMCGNGLRCVAAYLHLYKQLQGSFRVITDSGEKQVTVEVKGKGEYWVTSSLGEPKNLDILNRQEWSGNHYFTQYIEKQKVYTCNLGNNHIIVFLSPQKFQKLALDNSFKQLAFILRKNQAFNVNFCCVNQQKSLKIVTWQLGAGLTYACGTGSASSVFAGFKLKLLGQQTKVYTRGGMLVVKVSPLNKDEYQMIVEGPAQLVFTGEL